MTRMYRIRYREDDRFDAPDEVVVEANSPTEAMVKFHHACRGDKHAATRPHRERIVSICPEQSFEEQGW